MNQQTLINFRRMLHQYPEVANEEYQTAQRVVDFLQEFPPQQLLEQVGGTGIIATYESDHPGKHILIRCELDALPITEINDFAYKSTIAGKGHKCGHDGHMTMVAGLAPQLLHLPKGKVSLLFQPAEETGEGALQMLQDPQFGQVSPDYAFALHNMPGYPLHEILVKTDTFCAASKGMIVKLKGKTSHAAEPQNGVSPALAMAEIVQMLDGLPRTLDFDDFTLVTVVHALLGEVAFGVAPGEAEVRATLRTFANVDMAKLTEVAEQKAQEIAQKYQLSISIDYTEQFAATVNDAQSVKVVQQVAEKNGLSVTTMKQPNKWSEDFGQFIAHFPGALFGLGSGEHHPQLHNPDYDFPDELITTGLKMFWGIIEELL